MSNHRLPSRRTSRILAGLAAVLTLSACESAPGSLPTPPIHTPRWAFRPWISKDISTTDDSYSFVGGFRDRAIPIGVLVLDSPWETNYNTFSPNPVRYHDFGKLVNDMGTQHVRVVLWTTQMMNASSYDIEVGGDTYPANQPLFEQGKKQGFFVDKGTQYSWWKGYGAGLDFFNDGARAWWHELQTEVLNAGVSGWKLDFGDEYVDEDTVRTKAGVVPHQAYSEEYYRDSYAYGVQRQSAEQFVTMTRAWDESYNWPGRFYAKPEASPIAWMGDNRRDWFGLADALNEMFVSAEAGYTVVGSDIGGYLDVNDKNLTEPIPFDPETFIRWIGVGGIGPFMQLHGRANLEPWNAPARADDATTAYKYWATLHDALGPYYYSVAEEAYAGRGRMIDPQGAPETWPGDYRFLVGPAFFVAPFLDDTATRSVTLPPASNWYDWWDPDAPLLLPGTTLSRSYVGDPIKMPLFLREGSILPLDGEVPGTGLTADYATELGLPDPGMALGLVVTPSADTTTFALHDVAGDATLTVARDASGAITFTATGSNRPLFLRIRQDAAPTTVTANGAALDAIDVSALASTPGYYRDPAHPYTYVRLAASATQTLTL